jgi:hypothetical protein
VDVLQVAPEEALDLQHELVGLARLPAWAHLENHLQKNIHGVFVGLWPTDTLQIRGCVKDAEMAFVFHKPGRTR